MVGSILHGPPGEAERRTCRTEATPRIYLDFTLRIDKQLGIEYWLDANDFKDSYAHPDTTSWWMRLCFGLEKQRAIPSSVIAPIRRNIANRQSGWSLLSTSSGRGTLCICG